jgi:three-Cys-motif partner protein
MVGKEYQWLIGAKLEEHSKCKHKIIREYIFDYVTVRCKLPQQERFRLAIVDGFAGGGRYKCGAPGSPLIFIEELMRSVEAINTQRIVQGVRQIEVECLLVFNDANHQALELLKSHVAPLHAEVAQRCQKLHMRVEYLNSQFEEAYPNIKSALDSGRYKSVLFNLDQCGDVHVEKATIIDIMRSFPAAEIFYTFMIKSLLAFLQKSQPEKLRARLDHLGLKSTEFEALQASMSRSEWLGAAEKIVFDAFQICAPFVSPFSIKNPDGWRYWLIHFANSYRARQVYNNVLHANSTVQAHFGRPGLHMLAYDPRHEQGMLYLFDDNGRSSAKSQLIGDIPRLIMASGDALPVVDFYESIYNITPAHADDIHAAINENPDLEVITPTGGERRKANTIRLDDIIRVKRQKSFFPLFLDAANKESGSS